MKRQVVGEDAQEPKKAADAAKVAAALAKEDPLAPYAGMVLGSLTVSPIANSRLVELQLHLHRSAAGRRHGQRAREGLHRAEPRVQVLRVEGRHATGWASGSPSSGRRSRRARRRCSSTRKQHDAVAVEDRQNIVVQRLGGPERRRHQGEDGPDREGSAVQPAQVHPGDAGRRRRSPRSLANDYIQKLKSELGDLQRQQAQLGEKYGDRHPEMIKIRSAVQSTQAKLDIEVSKVVQSVQSEYQAALAQERSLVGALDSQKGEALSLNRKGIEYSVLNREAESNRQVYEALLQRTKETGISGRAEGEQHPRGGHGGSAEMADPAAPADRPDDGCAVRARCWRSAWCSSSSTSTTASSRRRSCARTWGCRSSAWCRPSTPAGRRS